MNTDTPKRKENIVSPDNTDVKKRKSDHSTKSDHVSHDAEDETEDEAKAIERLLTDPEDASTKLSKDLAESLPTVDDKDKSEDKSSTNAASSFFDKFKTSPFAEISGKQCIFSSTKADNNNNTPNNSLFSSSSPFASFCNNSTNTNINNTSNSNNNDIFKQKPLFSSSSPSFSTSSSINNKTIESIPPPPSVDPFKQTSFFSKTNNNNNNNTSKSTEINKTTSTNNSNNNNEGNGEENDKILFEKRAKGYLFDKEKSQYVHICTGPIRINKNNENKNIVRVIMRQESSETGQGLHVLVHLLIISATKIVLNNDSKRVTISSIDVRKNNQVETYAVSFFKSEDCVKFYNIICDEISLLKDV